MTTTTPILFVHYGDNWIRGSETTLFQLIETLDKRRYRPIVWSNCEPLNAKLTEQGVTTYCDVFSVFAVLGQHKWRIVPFLSLVSRAVQLIKQHQIKLIHVNSGAPCQWMSLASRLTKVPLLLQLHGDYPLRERFLMGFHLADKIVCVSEAISRELKKDRLQSNQLSVVHNGVALSHVQLTVSLKQALNIPNDHFTFVTVGSLIQRKGIDRLLKALYFLRNSQTPAHLVIIGDGPMRMPLATLCRKLNLEHRVHFLGERSDATSWLASNGDAFVSGAYQEAFGLVIAEAMMAGLPVIAPNLGGIPEFVNHGNNGLLYKSNAFFSLLKAMESMMNCESLARQLARQGEQDAQRYLTIQSNTQALQAEYDSLLLKRHPSPSWSFALKPLLQLVRRTEVWL
ncbi:glycosyltransferase [Vibrio sp. IRLE0018]|uniref:glycosyltransferase n=1 Tax=Vibrio floridensis TaxID=2908007 RepID=UPI001F1BDFEC|nr:glycosyltransferase [Vibrio floridensis]MCF8780027.1 glycosyltransferase [Vibrio floridensis]